MFTNLFVKIILFVQICARIISNRSMISAYLRPCAVNAFESWSQITIHIQHICKYVGAWEIDLFIIPVS